MKKRLRVMLIIFLPVYVFAQTPVKKNLRIVDSLTNEEIINRNPVLLRSEIDSLVKIYNIPQPVVHQPVQETRHDYPPFIYWSIALIIALLVMVLFILIRQKKKLYKLLPGLQSPSKGIRSIDRKGKETTQQLENKVGDLHAEIYKLSKENEGLGRVISEYNGIQHDFDSLKLQMQHVYKVKNYPGFDKSSDDFITMTTVLETEKKIAAYAYEKYIKPLLSLTDRHKNSPARINEEDSKKMLELLISLSLLYIEYLYLRVHELSVGGKIVERINRVTTGKGIEPDLLRKLNTESGNRALVLRMVLNRIPLSHLSYPVFDETNLNS